MMRSSQGHVTRTLATGSVLILLLATPHGGAQSQNVSQHHPRNEQSIQGKSLPRQAKEVQHEVSSVSAPQARVVYLVPSDVKPRGNFRQSASHAIQSLHDWYRVQVGGKTVKIHHPR